MRVSILLSCSREGGLVRRTERHDLLEQGLLDACVTCEQPPFPHLFFWLSLPLIFYYFPRSFWMLAYWLDADVHSLVPFLIPNVRTPMYSATHAFTLAAALVLRFSRADGAAPTASQRFVRASR